MRLVSLLVVLCLAVSGIAGCGSAAHRPFESYVVPMDATSSLEGLHGQFFGASTILIGDGRHAVLIDGFFSRPSVSRVLLNLGYVEPDRTRVDRGLDGIKDPRIDYVLVAHSHHDHAMDAPLVAALRGATLVGSPSTGNVPCGRACVAPPLFQATEAPLKRGDFTVRFLPALHAPYQFADAEGRSRDILDPLRAWLHARLAGDIDHALPTPTPIMEYKVGDNYLFVIEHARYGTVLVVPSAQVPLRLGGLQVNVVLLGVGDLDKASNEDIRTYWKEAVEDTNAKLVIPIHWDNFFHPLEDGLAPFPPVVDDVACAMETLSFLKSRHVAIRFMLPGEPVKLDAATAQALSDQEAQGAPSGLPDPFKDGCRARRGERRTG